MRLYLIIKRFLDILLSFIGILVSSPLLIVCALLVLLTSKGGIIFKDIRVGKKGKMIVVYKFRTMYIDAESNIDNYLSQEEKEKWNKERNLANDPRITKVGKFLRKTSIDELPQLFNILFGSMSIVGPRPISAREIEQNYSKEEAELLLSVTPGLIGVWGVEGRSNITYDNHARQTLELSYIEKRSLFFDIKLVFKAVPAVLLEKGAN